MVSFHFLPPSSIFVFAWIVLVATAAAAAAATDDDGEGDCTKSYYYGYNTDFSLTYNTEDGIDHPGDVLAWHAKVTTTVAGGNTTNEEDTVGELVGYCVRVINDILECDETIMLDGDESQGHLFVHYVQVPGKTTSQSAIIGGTDSYKHVTGQINFTAPPNPNDSGPWKIDMEVCEQPSTSSSATASVLPSVSLLFSGALLTASL